MKTYLFFLGSSSEFMDLPNDQEAKAVAERLPEITRVQKLDGTVIWADNNRLN